MADAPNQVAPAATAQEAGAAAAENATGAPKGEVTSMTVIPNIGALQKQAPELYNAMCIHIAQTICNQNADYYKRMKQMNRQSYS